jgi:uncharacterized repeat protein (TIGR02543 family)
VTLTATPAGGYAFSSWSGDAAGTDPTTTVVMDGDKSVTAVFEEISFQESVTVTIEDIETSGAAVKIMMDGTPGSEEYLLIENKVPISGTWTEFLPRTTGGESGEIGLLVMHIDNGIIAAREFYNQVNDGAYQDHGVAVVEADGDDALWNAPGTAVSDYGSDTDAFRAAHVDELIGYELNNGATAAFNITNVSAAGASMSFDIEY